MIEGSGRWPMESFHDDTFALIWLEVERLLDGAKNAFLLVQSDSIFFV